MAEYAVKSLDQLVRAGCAPAGITAQARIVDNPPGAPGPWVEISAVKIIAEQRFYFGGMLKPDELARLGPVAVARAFNAQAIHALAKIELLLPNA